MYRGSLSPRYRRLVIRAIASVAAVVLLVALGLALVNRVAVPHVLRRIEAQAEANAWELKVDGARYVPFRGIVLKGALLERTAGDRSVPPVSVTADRLRVRLRRPLRAARYVERLRDAGLPGGDPAPAPPRPVGAVGSVIGSVIGSIARASDLGVLPRRLVVRGVSVAVHIGGLPVALETTRLDLRDDRGDGVLTLAATPRREAPAPAPAPGVTADASVSAAIGAALRLDYRHGAIDGRAEVDVPPFRAGALSARGLDGEISFTTEDGERFTLDGRVELADATVVMPAVADAPLTGLELGYRFAALLDLRTASASLDTSHPAPGGSALPEGSVTFSAGELTANGLRFTVTPSLRGLLGGWRTLAAQVHLPDTPVQTIVDGVPRQISGPLAETQIDGTLAWDLDLRVPLDEISEMAWTASTRLSEFAVRRIHRDLNVYRVNGEFTHTIRDPAVDYERTVRIPAARPASIEWMLLHSEHTQRQIERIREENRAIAAARPEVTEFPVPDGAPDRDARVPDRQAPPGAPAPDPAYRYVRVDDVSPWVVRVVLTAEDGDFFFYGGVNPVTLADAIERNIREGEIVLGASTISMQLVKMLFLDQERIFSRKLQEVFLVYLLEHQVPVSKERILELYLNLAEFGPGVYGIHDAARYYFDRDPADLTAGEATWLASILPSPKTYHRYFEEGRISDAWFRRMIGLYDIMLERGRMTPEEYAAAVARRPVFRPGRPASAPATGQ